MSAKSSLKNTLVKCINATGISSRYLGSPKGHMPVSEWYAKYGSKYNAQYKKLSQAVVVNEQPPVTIEESIHRIYEQEYVREQPERFVAQINNCRVWGRSGTVIAPNDILLSDVSREFGAYGGVMGAEHSVNNQLSLSSCTYIKGNIAIVGCAGAYNYHHWLYDTVTRVGTLKEAGLFNSIDKFILDYTGKKFQKESLEALGIREDQIINADDSFKFHVQAENLVIPSLSAKLGTINKWTVDFLRSLFLVEKKKDALRLYISRRKAPSRKVVNEDEVMEYLAPKGFIEFFPEDHSVKETASYFASADYIIGVHGSGFANFAFLSQGTKTIDIVAPKHLDPYYWILNNHTGSTYGYLFGKGERPEENTDLVVSKVDHDIMVDIAQLDKLYKKLERQEYAT